MSTHRLALLLLLSALTACSDAPDSSVEDAPASSRPRAQEPPPPPPPVPATPPDEFTFSSAVAEDLTGDGIADTLRVEAAGPAPLAIQIAFAIRSKGSEIYRLEWVSHEYFRYEPDLAMSDDEPAKFTLVRAHLDSILAASNFGSLEPGMATADPQGRLDPDTAPVSLISGQLLLPFFRDSLTSAGVDSASIPRAAARLAYRGSRVDPRAPVIWRAMTDAELRTFVLYAGGENTRRLAWSTELGRFMTIWSCC